MGKRSVSLTALVLLVLPSCALTLSFDDYGTTRGSSVRGVRMAASGFMHACAVLATGEVRCWGENEFGQLGDGTRMNRGKPVVVAGLAPAVAVTTGYRHTCALHENAVVSCWGGNDLGQLGDGGDADRGPALVADLGEATALVGGDHHTCVLTAHGDVRCWGRIRHPQAEGGDKIERKPVTIAGMSGATKLVAAKDLTCALVANGEVRCFGPYAATFEWQHQPGVHAPVGITGATAIATSGTNACALVDGVPHCWGSGLELGFDEDAPVPAFAVPAASGATNLFGVAGKMCATMPSRDVICWEADGGPRSLEKPALDRELFGTPLFGATEVIAGYARACAFLNGGDGRSESRLRCWGYNLRGQVGDDSFRTSWDEAELTNARALVMGDGHRCAIVDSDQAACWGANARGQAGIGSFSDRVYPFSPQKVRTTEGSPLGRLVSIAAGKDHACVLTGGGAAWCWGGNELELDGVKSRGILGNATRTDAAVANPVLVDLPNDLHPTRITAAAAHTCVLADSQVYCWGSNGRGQLGDVALTTADEPWSALPLRAPAVTIGAKTISAGGAHTCALLVSNAIVCWGGYPRSAGEPSVIEPFPGFAPPAGSTPTALAGGDGYSCVLFANGDVTCWGVSGSRYPTPASVATGASAIAAGRRFSLGPASPYDGHACALKGDTVQCWGENWYGELGDGTSVPSTTPVNVVDVSATFLAGSLGFATSCALVDTRTNGGAKTSTARCWGEPSTGEQVNVAVPQFVADLP
jgi:alpha-tubulin suppressor-like RCC1 family protein